MSNGSSSNDDIGPRVPANFVVKKRKIRASNAADAHKPMDGLSRTVMERCHSDAKPTTFAIYEHCQPVTHLFESSETEFVVSLSGSDGCVKFWKNEPTKLEFVKEFNLGSAALGACFSQTGSGLAILTRDNYLRVFDVVNFNMMAMIQMDSQLIWSQSSGGTSSLSEMELVPMIFLADANLLAIAVFNRVAIFNISALAENPRGYTPNEFDGIHIFSITHMGYSSMYDCIVSTDIRGFIEIWPPGGISPSIATNSLLGFSSKLDTDLFELNSANETAKSLRVSKDGACFLIVTNESNAVKAFRVYDGNLIKF